MFYSDCKGFSVDIFLFILLNTLRWFQTNFSPVGSILPLAVLLVPEHCTRAVCHSQNLSLTPLCFLPLIMRCFSKNFFASDMTELIFFTTSQTSYSIPVATSTCSTCVTSIRLECLVLHCECIYSHALLFMKIVVLCLQYTLSSLSLSLLIALTHTLKFLNFNLAVANCL